MQKIISNLWFDGQAEEAVNFYSSIFKNSSIGKISRYGKVGFEIHGQPEGKLMTMEFEIEGESFLALNGGPQFKFNLSVSFLVACQSKEEVERLWNKLSPGGTPLMELGSYPFSDKYGWIQDKYGLSWQIMLEGEMKVKQRITPTLMFVGAQCGKAEEAMNYYTTIFERLTPVSGQNGPKVGGIVRYGKGDEPDLVGTVKHAYFVLGEQEFFAMDSARMHDFAFNEAISFIVRCEDQAEIDYYWDRLTAGGDPAAQVCGWLKDKYGFSWQITPTILEAMMSDQDQKKTDRVMAVFLQMKKIDIAKLNKAFEG
jgi:predicted 3-demethylubiquinone-9 3-methyltransferase (glyoxalase superfamily)